MKTKTIIGIILIFLSAYSVVLAADLTALVPADAALVVNINLAKLLSSATIKKQIDDSIAKQSPAQKKAYDDFIVKTGIDPLKHIKGFCLFLKAQTEATGEKTKGGVFIEGTFDVQKILNAVKSDPQASADTVVEKFEGFDAIRGKKDPDSIGVFLDNSTAIIGNTDVVKNVIEVKNGKSRGLSTNPTFSDLMKKVDLSASIYGIGFIPPILKEQAKANPQFAPLAAINALFFSFNYDPDLTFSFTGEVDKKESLEGVMTTINGFLAMIKMMAAQTPEAAEILNMIKVESVESAVKITLNVSKAKLDEIRKKVEERLKSIPQGESSGSDNKK